MKAPKKKTYRIDGTRLTFKAEDYYKANDIVNEIDHALDRWAKENKINRKKVKSIIDELDIALGFDPIDPKTGRITYDDDDIIQFR